MRSKSRPNRAFPVKALVAVGLTIVGIVAVGRVIAGTDEGSSPPAVATGTAADAGATAPSGAGGASPASRRPRSPNVRITFRVMPPKGVPAKATVMWGKKKLGVLDQKTPLVVQRPRDSGPLDVVVRADNCLPVHTRAYTFTDSTVAVKVTPTDQKNTIYGYKEDLPVEGQEGFPDGSSAGAPAGSPAGSSSGAAGAGGFFSR